MPERNKHVKDFIEFYCSLKDTPEYALLIKGPWGCGKSHFVESAISDIEDRNDSTRFLSVSLYGINSVEDIEAKFFQILNPVLTSKGAVLAGSLAKGFLRGAFKFDIDGDGSADGSVKLEIPGIDLSKYMTDTSDLILVFDDIERCTMDLGILFGYINYFVEKEGYKVILIADEDKIYSDNSDFDYRLVKEKLIGVSLEVSSERATIYNHFIDDLDIDENCRRKLRLNQDAVLTAFDHSGYNNLRSLRKMILSFNRLWNDLSDELKESRELIENLLKLFTVLSMEIYSGGLLIKDIGEFIGTSDLMRKLTAGKDKEEGKDEDPLNQVVNKYDISFLETLIDVNDWIDLFDKGKINKDKINLSLKSERHFQKENAPNWKKLWPLYELNDEEFDDTLRNVRCDIENYKLIDPGVVKHVFGTFIKLSVQKLIPDTLVQVISGFTSYIDYIFDNGLVDINVDTSEEINRWGNYLGLGFHSEESAEFEELSRYLNERIESYSLSILSTYSSELLGLMREKPRDIGEFLTATRTGTGYVSQSPILIHMDSGAFITAYLSMDNKDKRYFHNAFSNRYEDLHPKNLISEVGFLEKLVSEFKCRVPSINMKPSHLNINCFIEIINEVIRKMQSHADANLREVMNS